MESRMTGSDGSTLKEAETAEPVRVIGFKGELVSPFICFSKHLQVLHKRVLTIEM